MGEQDPSGENRSSGRPKRRFKRSACPLQAAHRAQFWNNRGIWLLIRGKPYAAARCFRRACRAWPRLKTAWTNLAAVLMMIQRFDLAYRTLAQAARYGVTVTDLSAGRVRYLLRLSLITQANARQTRQSGHRRNRTSPAPARQIAPPALRPAFKALLTCTHAFDGLTAPLPAA